MKHPAVSSFPPSELPVNRLPDCSFFVVTLLIISCAGGSLIADESEISAAQLEFFEKDVRPLLVSRCYECHSAKDVQGGLSLDSRAGVRQGGDSGPVIVPGQPDQSRLIEAVRYENRDLQMPPKNKLPDAEIAVLEKWIRLGAPDPRVAAATESADGPTGMSIEEGRRFWSFRPVTDPPVPDVRHADRARNPIDAFLLAELERQGIEPAPPADRQTLIRRVTFDLTGLPPTPEEVANFLNDESDDAWSKVVERLLASPHYGVRWGRHWLDVARYADSNGLDENLAFGNAWRYRDYVVAAFNGDKPYDQFVLEQLAGDLLPHANRETKTATGFLVLGAKVLAEPDLEKLIMDTVDEQLDSMGKAFMGMTFGCCRCHDHKFDPLKQSDYYALGAIFKSTKTFAETRTGVIKHWYEHEFSTEEELEKIKKIDEQLAKLRAAASSYKNKAMARIRDEARAKATEYLMACTLFEPSASLAVISEIARQHELHPRILHHCRRHLEFNRDDAFFAPWQSLARSGGANAVEQHYRPLFEGFPAALKAAKETDPKATTIPDPSLEAARLAIHDLSGFLAVPPKVDYAFDSETLKEYYRLEDEARVFESQAPDKMAAMGTAEEKKILTALPIHIRGSHLNLGEPVPREFPAVMRRSEVRPVFPAAQSGRLQFARWLASTQHPLTARVFVNRVWGWHFGRGIVGTTENFGFLGDRPTHPELLDWLSVRFMESGWSVKALHRLILESNAYQMASRHPAPATAAADPENRLLWKFRLQRLEAEQIRDAILASSGRLDVSLGGKTVPLRNRQFVFNHTSVDHTKYDSLRRALYLPIIRNNLYSLFEQFDFPDPTMPTGHRNSTVVAPQALLMMNSDLVMESADAMAKSLIASAQDDRERVHLAYQRAFGRPPVEAELNRAINFVGELTSAAVTATGVSTQDQLRAWSVFCQGLYASNEFIYVR